MKLCIPVCVSFDCKIDSMLKQPPYLLVGGGGFKSDVVKMSDDIGDSISQYNLYLNEMTVMYWAAKNYAAIGSPEYIGLGQYRRLLQFNEDQLDPNAVVCYRVDYKMALYMQYQMYHVKSDLDAFINFFKEDIPDMFSSLCQFLMQTTSYERNMFVMHHSKFNEYFNFIEKCIEICIGKVMPMTDIENRDQYQRRALGFILERMTGLWIYDQVVIKKAMQQIDAQILELKIDSPYQRV